MLSRRLLHTLATPDLLSPLDLEDWNRLVPLGRRTGVLGRLYPAITAKNLQSSIPAVVLPHLEAACILAQEHERMIRWEVNQIQRALRTIPVPIILLKGAAYVMAGLPCARGRLVADVDILVHKEQLAVVEQALARHGWDTITADTYDQQYYRRWMHELPPLRHRLRGTVVDLHHAILPETSRLKPDPAKLFANARPLEGTPFFVLASTDMVLHTAAHAFHDGELSNSLRDLLDLHDLLQHFGKDSGFWETLPSRARELELSRPLFYALRYTQRFLETPIPPTVITALYPAAPPRPVLRLMDSLLDRILLPGEQPPRLGLGFARWLLYVRSHWLRMPPWLLTRHLFYKSYKRLQAHSAKASQEVAR